MLKTRKEWVAHSTVKQPLGILRKHEFSYSQNSTGRATYRLWMPQNTQHTIATSPNNLL